MDSMSLTERYHLEMDLKILNITFQTGDVLIKFQGKYLSDSEFDYQILQREIQLVTKTTEDIDVGQFCLVQDKPFGSWHRGKILDKVNQKSEVALIDEGNVIKVPSSQIASATGELFILPPKVVNGIISNLLPLVEKWTPRAVNYFSTLVGQQLHGHVKTFLPHQVMLLEIPKVISHATEFGLAKYVDSESFCLLVEIIHKFPANSHCKQMPDLLQQKEICSDVTLALPNSLPRFQKLLDHLRPEFSTNIMEKIKISAAVSPNSFFCHVLSWETELNKLTASMSCHYASAVTETSSSLDSFGVLCAAKRKDGSWYRGVIQKLMSCNDVKIWFIDIGSSETIPFTNVRKLESEFLSLPMMAIPCALSQDKDHIESVKNVQLALFKEALMGRVVIGHIQDYSTEERLYYLSLYNADFEFSVDCHLTDLQVPSFFLNPYKAVSEPVVEKCQNLSVPEAATSTEMQYNETVSYKSVKMELESVYVAYVEYAVNPSTFWIRVDDSQKDFTEIMAGIVEKYNKFNLMEMVLQDPKSGQLCCARYALDGHYYRAVVTEVLSPQISVYFIDFGNTETVPFYDVKVLLPQFSALPALAMCCSLAYACPVDDVWVKAANDFFKQTVNGKALLCHVVAKQKYQYVVEMRLSESSNSSDIVTLLVKSGFAEFWKVDLNSNSINLDKFSKYNTQHEKPNRTFLGKSKRTVDTNKHNFDKTLVSLDSLALKLKPAEQRSSFGPPDRDLQTPGTFAICFKQHLFKPGEVIDVKVSHVDSPDSFWCQLSGNASKLSTLMEDMQKVYSCCDSLYQYGQVACIAKSSCNGKYYRAAVGKYVSAHECVVTFIDYGNTEKVLISELREIKTQFLELEGQAFRCCLSKVFSPPPVHYKWSVNACKDFKSLVQSTPDVMKCTMVALFSRGSENLCNAVNLETRFGNANKILTDKGHLVSTKTVPTLHLHTYCYSNFDLEVGSREEVYVTYIYNTGKFYCHLAKNEEIIDMLSKKVAKLGNMLKPATKPNELCIVKHAEDGNFYRALACPMESSSLFLAFFVDFGDSQIVKESELLPIPEDAGDLLFQPIQAIPCYLAGMTESPLTIKAKAWFEEQCLGQLLNAVLVARNKEGQLELELSNTNISINQEITKFGIKSVRGKKQLNVCEDSSSMKNQRDSDSYDILLVNTSHESDSVPITKSIDQLDDNRVSCSPKLIKSVYLPPIFLTADTTCLVYASHVDSPSSFFVHLAKQEDDIFQLLEELNKLSFQVINERDLEEGLLVVAQYPEDEAYYRAEIKDVLQDSFCVEFIDYGNKANVDASRIFILPERFLTIPRLSIPAFLTGIQKLLSHAEWSNKVTEMFFDKVKSEPFDCKFMCKYGPQWEVSISLEGQSLSETLIQSFEFPSKPAAAITKDCPLKSDLDYFNISNESTIEDSIANESINVPTTKTLRPGLAQKVKNISLSESGTLLVTLANFSEESKLKLHIAATVEQFGNRLSAKEIKEGMVCLAKSEKMQVWLRASVEKLMPSAMRMEVSFVDHGAHEILSMHNAKKLSLEALSIPKQSIVCQWIGTEQIDPNVFAANLKSILQKEIRIIFLEFLECTKVWKVEILVDGLLLLHYLHSVRSSADINFDKTNSYAQAGFTSSQIPRNRLKSLEVCPGFITSFNSPSSFFVQLTNSVTMMDTFSQLMQIQFELTPIAGDSLKPGSSCLVRSFDDQEWCRAEIMSINMNFILLYLLDYGVDKIIPYLNYKELKMIPKKLSCFPALTFNCSLYGVMPDAGNWWSKDAISYCIRFVKKHNLLILPVKHLGKNIEEVSVYGQGSLAMNLVRKGLAKVVEIGDKSEMMYHFPTLSLDANRNCENIGYRGPCECKNTLCPSRPNGHVEAGQDCKAGCPCPVQEQ